MSLIVDIRCNRCGYCFPLPLVEPSCPHCDAREDHLRRIAIAAHELTQWMGESRIFHGEEKRLWDNTVAAIGGMFR